MKDYNAVSVATFDKSASRYAEKYFGLRDYDAYYEQIAVDLRHGPARFLDLACGPGNVSAYVRARCPQAEILCVDKSTTMLGQVMQRVANVEVLAADCRDLSAINGGFDAAAFFFGLSYFDDIDAPRVLAQLQRVLLPGAPLLLATVAGDPSLSGFQVNAEGDGVFSFYREQPHVQDLIREAGFALVLSARIPSPANASFQSSDLVLIGRRT